MKITGKKRIRKAHNYLLHVAEGAKAYIGLTVTEVIAERLKQIGFENLNPGVLLVPSPRLGSVSKFNSIGKFIPQRDKPKETAYRQQHWEWTDWGGNSHSRTVDIPYKRYPRKEILPPWVELQLLKKDERLVLLAGSSITKGETEETAIVHRINLLLEIFKQVEIFQEDFKSFEIPKPIKLNWDILPPGEMPWEQFKSHLTPVLENMSKGKKTIIADRIETVSQYQPDFHVIGKNGYRGYIIFGFTKQNLFIFENAEYGNATYVFEGSDWDHLSQLTKAEIITGNLHKHRFIHLDGWKEQIASLFPSENQIA